MKIELNEIKVKPTFVPLELKILIEDQNDLDIWYSITNASTHSINQFIDENHPSGKKIDTLFTTYFSDLLFELFKKIDKIVNK